ncbi:cbb3-type cytochrome oxidase assembly protein CcoS [Flavitalea flava]
MSAIILLLFASLSVAVLFLGAFIWSVKNRQFEDGYSPPRRILFEDPTPVPPPVLPIGATDQPKIVKPS